MNVNKLRPIILAGGSGKRLWPLSTKDKPKQFIPLFGEYSLFDLTLTRINKASLFKKPIIVTSKSYLHFVEDSIVRTGIDVEKVILEPCSKNTFPAISMAVMIALLKNKDESFIVAPSDHYMSKNKDFHKSCRLAKNNLDKAGLILFSVKPERASSEYGYILVNNLDKEINEVNEFFEKPNSVIAKKIFNKPDTFWNAGMFAFKGSWFIEACNKVNKEALKELDSCIPKDYPKTHNFLLNEDNYKNVSNSSFDKAFVERNDTNYAVSLDSGWLDLGSWVSLSALQRDPKSEMTIFSDSHNFKEKKPWGFFETLMETETSKVKLLSVSPNQKLSLQKHRFRSETWYVIRGEAKITKGNERFTMVSGDSVVIKQNEEHRLENISDERLEIIEIQTGTYFGEDDIIRIEDSYGRADLH